MKRIAILGAGNIACAMARTVNGMAAAGEAVELYAVAAREEARAREFQEKWGVTKAYGSYEAMLQDDLVDLVYIATPHAFHGEHMALCVKYGRAVLCEKAFTGNARQAREALTLAENAGVPVTEAIWTRYMPYRTMLNDLIAQGTIGEVRHIQANLGYPVSGKERILRPELAGGALLDLGVYTINFAAMVLGDQVTEVSSTVRMMPSGCDLQESIHMSWASGATAVLVSTAACRTDRRGIVYGDKGRLQVDNINNPQEIRQYDGSDRLLRVIPVPRQITGYEYQVRAALRMIEEGRLECPEMPHAETIRVMELMDSLRRSWRMVYPFD